MRSGWFLKLANSVNEDTSQKDRKSTILSKVIVDPAKVTNT